MWKRHTKVSMNYKPSQWGQPKNSAPGTRFLDFRGKQVHILGLYQVIPPSFQIQSGPEKPPGIEICPHRELSSTSAYMHAYTDNANPHGKNVQTDTHRLTFQHSPAIYAQKCTRRQVQTFTHAQTCTHANFHLQQCSYEGQTKTGLDLLVLNLYRTIKSYIIRRQLHFPINPSILQQTI